MKMTPIRRLCKDRVLAWSGEEVFRSVLQINLWWNVAFVFSGRVSDTEDDPIIIAQNN